MAVSHSDSGQSDCPGCSRTTKNAGARMDAGVDRSFLIPRSCRRRSAVRGCLPARSDPALGICRRYARKCPLALNSLTWSASPGPWPWPRGQVCGSAASRWSGTRRTATRRSGARRTMTMVRGSDDDGATAVIATAVIRVIPARAAVVAGGHSGTAVTVVTAAVAGASG